MIGRKLVDRLVADGRVGDAELERLTLVDVVAPDPPAAGAALAGDLADPAAAQRLVDARPDVIVHLAAVVSGEAEADFDKGYRVNLDGTRTLLEAIRAADAGYRPRLVFASSIAVFGAPLPDPIPEDFAALPLTSYGTQKAIDELLLADYTRRGFVDGVGIRLPTICIRPGAPEQGGVRVLLQHPARAAGRPRGGAAGARDRAALARLAPLGRRVLSCARRRRHGADRAAAHAVDAGPVGHGRRADRGAAPRGRRGGGAADPPRARSGRSCGWSAAGRRRWTRAGRSASGSSPRRRSTRSSACTWRTSCTGDPHGRDAPQRGSRAAKPRWCSSRPCAAVSTACSARDRLTGASDFRQRGAGVGPGWRHADQHPRVARPRLDRSRAPARRGRRRGHPAAALGRGVRRARRRCSTRTTCSAPPS